MKRLVGGDFLLDMSPIEIEKSVDGTTKTNITDNEVLGQLTDLKRFIGSPSMVKPIWCKLTNGETDELIVARGTLAVVDVGEFEICIPLDGYKLKISVEFTQMETEDHTPLDDWYIDTNDAKYLLISDTQSLAGELADFEGDASITGDVSVTGDLSVTGDTEFDGDVKCFEDIVDAQGNKRFIEGDIDIETIAGVTKTYGKWSLSGSHLMVVVCFAIANATTISAGAKVCDIDIPSWILDKIAPLHSVNVSVASFITLGSGEDTNITYVLSKGANSLNIKFVSGYTSARDESTRIQFDLLIDNETPTP